MMVMMMMMMMMMMRMTLNLYLYFVQASAATFIRSIPLYRHSISITDTLKYCMSQAIMSGGLVDVLT